MVRRILDSKGAFYKGTESDNNDESYNENNEQQQLREAFANSCYKIVSPVLLQKLINDFAVCKHYSPIRLTSLIFAEKFEFENPAIMEDKQSKQTERFSVMTKGRDYFLS